MDSTPPLPQPAYFRYWGKARPDAHGSALFHLLPYHCLDVAAVGVEALRRMPALRALLSDRLSLGGETLDRWIGFWLAVHDLGKFSEAFQSQRADLFAQLRGRPPAKTYTLRHDSVGMLFWKDVLGKRVSREEMWFGPDSADFADGLDWWARAVTGHHGQPPKEDDDWRQHFDALADREATLAFVDEARRLFLDEEVLQGILRLGAERFLDASTELSWWVAGLAVLADWLGSNTDHFKYRDAVATSADALADHWRRARRQAAQALEESGVLPVPATVALPFGDLFPAIASPSPLQDWASTVALSGEPQIHLLEDVTGAGKTEAAVMLAHRIIARGAADGFFVGLPTMATANAMYGRIARVYARLFAGHASLVLANGQRNLVEAFAASVIPPGPAELDPRQLDQTATARCTAWLADHNKRALLAPAGVGTLDQALLAVLQSRHQSLRLLGLLRKVLVVDEVHACDAYMQSVLEVLLEFHARAGGSAILLSATLPRRMKNALLKAFAKGRRAATPVSVSAAYPLATSWPVPVPSAFQEIETATRPDVRRRVRLYYATSQDEV